MKTIVFQIGSEWAPDSPYGLDVLEIDVDGRFRYENRMRGQVRASSGRVELGTLDVVVDSLREAGFPAVPSHAIPPGSSLIGIQVRGESGDEAALMDYFTALKLPGYGDVIRRLAGWVSWLRKGETEEPAPPGLIRD